MSNPPQPQGDFGGNPPVPGSGENGGRRDGLSPELVEHRLNELEGKTKEIAQEVKGIASSVKVIETGMITKKELLNTVLIIAGSVIVLILSVAAHWLVSKL